jgi:histidinol-phosphatase
MSAPVEPYADDLALALQLADIGDQLAMQSFRDADLVIETKPDFTPVTEADRGVERALRETLAQHRPTDSIVGEEYGSAGTSSRRWVLDPIDGTKNYVRGVPVWAVLIALMEGDDIVVGVVSAPALSRRWWARAGGGAFGIDPTSSVPRRLQVSGVRSLEDASFSYSDDRGWSERGADVALRTLTRDSWRTRAYGDFWSHMMVAEGVVDIAAEPELENYDMAALVPIVQEAGGLLTAYDGGSALAGGSALSTNGHLHETVLGLLANP